MRAHRFSAVQMPESTTHATVLLAGQRQRSLSAVERLFNGQFDGVVQIDTALDAGG